MSVKFFGAAAAGAVFMLSGLPAAQAASPAVCQDYARAALRQVHVAREIPRCAAGIGGTRWSADYRVHFDWCAGASFAAIGEERDARTGYLKSCR